MKTESGRRDFLKQSAAAGGGLLIAFYLPDSAPAVMASPPPAARFAPNAFLRIGTDETITVIVNKSEMGQGVYTSLPMLVAEELEADWSRIRVEPAPVDPVYNHTGFGTQITGGSSSISSSWVQFRMAGATAKAMLLAAAAVKWKVDPGACVAENGRVLHKASKRSLSFGQLAVAASRLTPPKEAPLKDPKDFKLIGKRIKRLDGPEKTDGSAIFGMDVKVPGMLTAVILRPPVFSAKLKRLQSDKAKAIRGVRAVVPIDSGVAVVADGFWPATQGRDALEAEWDEGPNGQISSQQLREEYSKLAYQTGMLARNEGDAVTEFPHASIRVEATYEVPYLAHAPMEPLNCVADVRSDRCEIWTGSQMQTADRWAAAQAAGLKPEQVVLHTTLLGGGFGRRAVPDSHFVREAVLVSKAVKAPVKVIWTREDDVRGGYYRPMYRHDLKAGLDCLQDLTCWWHRIVGQSVMAGTPFEAFLVKNGIDGTSTEGAADLPYPIPNLRVELHTTKVGVPVLWLRSVGGSHNAYVIESFLDEVAVAAERDPYEFRRGLLADHPRHLKVLDLVAQKAGWGKSLPRGQGRGIAVFESYGSVVAQVAQVSVDKQRGLRVERVVCAIDCGTVVNPDMVEAQMESAVVFGLTAALYGEITLSHGRVDQSNFHDYRMLQIDQMPAVEVHIVKSSAPPSGVGEPGVPPIAPAVTNAIFAATGERIRKLPIRLAGHEKTK